MVARGLEERCRLILLFVSCGLSSMEALLKWLAEKGHSQHQLAKDLGISQGAISQWMQKGEIPIKRVPAVARSTGIPAAQLRPDVFGSADVV